MTMPPLAPNPIRQAARRERQRGIALVEYALATPLLLMLLAAALDYGMSLRTAAEVSAAAEAGAVFGSSSTTNSSNTGGMQAAATNSAPNLTGMTVTAVRSCQCPGGAPVSCTGTCTGKMLIYVQVTAQATTSAIFSYSSLGFSGLTSAQVKMRVQ